MSLGCVYEDGLCEQLSQKTKLNRLNERDLSLSASVAESFIPGVDLNVAVFDKYGYILNSTNIIKDVLDAGLRRLYLDVYWDTVGEGWHLCPVRPPVLSSNSTAIPNVSVPVRTLLTKSGMETAEYKKKGSTTTVPVEPRTPLPHQQWTSLPGPVPGTSDGKGSALKEIVSPGTSSTGTGTGTAAKDSANYTIAYLQNQTKCDYQLDFQQFVSALRDYVDLSDTNVAASLIYLQLRPNLWPTEGATTSKYPHGQRSLNETLYAELESRILKPSVVEDYVNKEKKPSRHHHGHQGWPTMKNVLYSNNYRVAIGFNNSLASTIPDLNRLSSLAFASTPTIADPLSYSVEALSRRNFTDVMIHDSNEWMQARYAGVSPVISYGDIQIYDGSLLQLLGRYEYWAWGPQQPILYSETERKDMLSGGYTQNQRLVACAVFTDVGMQVANCNSHFPVLCKHKNDDLDWVITDDTHSYFDPSCPSNYEFAAPSSPLEARAIRELDHNFSESPAWIDFNSLYFTNCWVTGGTNAVCPYNIRQNGRNGIGYIAVAACVAFFALLFITLFEWDRGNSPLMRKNLKRDKTNNAEFDGVPS